MLRQITPSLCTQSERHGYIMTITIVHIASILEAAKWVNEIVSKKCIIICSSIIVAGSNTSACSALHSIKDLFMASFSPFFKSHRSHLFCKLSLSNYKSRALNSTLCKVYLSLSACRLSLFFITMVTSFCYALNESEINHLPKV